MRNRVGCGFMLALGCWWSMAGLAAQPTYAELMATMPDADWVGLDPQSTLYLELETGRVVIALAADYAPRHVANLRRLAKAGYFDGLTVTRVQDNYVTQWGNDNGARPLPKGITTLAPEFDRAIAADLPFTPLADGDVYAPLVGHSRAFPVASDPKAGRTWLTHCYGMVGVGRDMAPDSGSGEELYVVIGQSPRALDRNVTLVGRVVSGMDLLSALPRGKGPMGFYTPEQARPRILSTKLAADVPAAERSQLEVFDSASPDFLRLIDWRRHRQDEFFRVSPDKIDLCSATVPVRPKPGPEPAK